MEVDVVEIHPEEKIVLEDICSRGKKTIQMVHGIFRKLSKKICVKFVEDQFTDEENICQCGLPFESHNTAAEENSDDEDIESWESSLYTKKEQTDAFGEVEFQGNGQATRAKFVRLSDDTDHHDIWELLNGEWKLELPDVLVNVVGGFKEEGLSQDTTELFQKEIWKIVHDKAVWIITNGTNKGTSKLVGQSLQGALKTSRRFSIPSYCIGIAPWGVIDQKDRLKAEIKRKMYHVKSGKESTCCLESNHSHFLLVDNGTVDSYWTDQLLRYNLVDHIREQGKYRKNRGNFYLPTVCLVVGGGMHAIKAVRHSVDKLCPIPVVIFQGSGRAAKLLHYACKLSVNVNDMINNQGETDLENLKEKIKMTFNDKSEKELEEIYNDLIVCIERKNSITFFDAESADSDLERVMVEQLMLCCIDNIDQQMFIALSWNNPDLARRTCLAENHSLPSNCLNAAMTYCLRKDMVEFAMLLLDNGVSMSRYLKRSILYDLYKERENQGDSILKELIHEKETRTILKTVGADAAVFLEHLKQGKNNIPNEESIVTYPFKELFIWATLNNMFDMAYLMLQYGYHPLAKALVGSHLFQLQAHIASKNEATENLSEKMLESKSKLCNFSMSLFNECLDTNKNLAQRLLVLEIPTFAHCNGLMLAVIAKHEEFVALGACQSLLSKVWYGGINFGTYQTIKVLLGIIFFFTIPWIPFQKEEYMSKITKTKEGEVNRDPNSLDEEDCVKIREKEKVNTLSQTQEEIASLESASPGKSIVNDEKIEKKETQNQHWFLLDVQVAGGSMQTNANEKTLHWKKKYKYFGTAPVTKFLLNMLCYFAFLLLLSYVVVTELPKSPSVIEWIVFGWVLTLTVEEIHQVFVADGQDYKNSFKLWFRNMWNKMDLLAIVLYYVAFGLRFHKKNLLTANVLYGIDCMIWIIRLLELLAVNKYLGAYVIMIWKMMKDLLYFLFVLGIFLWAYSVARFSILGPHSAATWTLFEKVFYIPYLQTFGELFIERQGSATKTVFETPKYFVGAGTLGVIMLNLYLLLANVLLLNLLIAVFNNTYTEVQTNAYRLWRYRRYDLVIDYVNRPFLPGPLAILYRIWMLFAKCKDKCKSKSGQRSLWTLLGGPSLSLEEERDLKTFERDCLVSVLKANIRNTTYSTDDSGTFKRIMKRIDFLETKTARDEETLIRNECSRIEKEKKIEAEKRSREMERELKQEKWFSILLDTLESMRRDGIQHVQRPEVATSSSSLDTGEICQSQRTISSVHNEELVEETKTLERDYDIHPIEVEIPGEPRITEMEKFAECLVDSMGSFRSQAKEEKADSCIMPIQVPSVLHNTVSTAYKEMPSEAHFPILMSCGSVEEEEVSLDTSLDKTIETFAADISPWIREVKHHLSLKSPYVGSVFNRFPVDEKHSSWNIPYPQYRPPEYTSRVVLAQVSWADPHITNKNHSLQFNEDDGEVNRTSYEGVYEVIRGIPRNIIGRTGLTGRGILGRWGPNHIVRVIMTRCLLSEGKPTQDFQFLAKEKKSSTMSLALPMGVVTDGLLPEEIIKAFDPSEIDKLRIERKIKKKLKEELTRLLSNPALIRAGYEDDERNTDNAWIETTNYEVCDYSGQTLQYFLNEEPEEKNKLHWVDLSCKVHLSEIEAKLISELYF